ncbi:MAG: type II secretion system protein GspG [Candidatus Binatia bacterium]
MDFHSKDPILAAILSVIIPGLGQFYCRQWVRGLLFLFSAFFLAFLAPPLGTLLSAGVWVWGIMDAYRIAKAAQGYSHTGEGPVIDVSRFRLPKVELRRALPYVGVPLGFVLLVILVATIVTFRSGLWKDSSLENNLRRLTKEIENYKAQTGSYPESLQSIIDPEDPIEKKRALDPWGNLYVYRQTEKGFDLFSAGKDGRPGTSDDVPHRP